MGRSIKEDVERSLEKILKTDVDNLNIPEGAGEADIQNAMRYICFPVGHLWRPRLLWAIAQGCEVERDTAMFYGAAVEVVHAASLAEDDTPMHDNSLWRRDKLSCWKYLDEKYKQKLFEEGDGEIKKRVESGEFDEESYKFGINITRSAIEILEKKLYFAIIEGPAPNGQMPKILKELLSAQKEMWPGQMTDVHYTKELGNLVDFTDFYRRKTGALFGAAAALGAILGGRKGYADTDTWRKFGVHLGVSYQLTDDLLELTGERTTKKSVEEYKDKKIIFDVVNLDSVVETREVYLKKSKSILTQLGVQRFDAVNKHFHLMDSNFRERFNYDKSLESYIKLKGSRGENASSD